MGNCLLKKLSGNSCSNDINGTWEIDHLNYLIYFKCFDQVGTIDLRLQQMHVIDIVKQNRFHQKYTFTNIFSASIENIRNAFEEAKRQPSFAEYIVNWFIQKQYDLKLTLLHNSTKI